MDKNAFIQECDRQLTEHFKRVKAKKVDEAMKHRIQGFINAGEFLGVVNRDEAVKLIDETHFKVFGMTKEQRKAHKQAIKSLLKGEDEGVFDIPAIERCKHIS